MNEHTSHANIRLVLRAVGGEPLEGYDQRHFETLTPSERATFFRLLDKILAGSYGRLVQHGTITQEEE